MVGGPGSALPQVVHNVSVLFAEEAATFAGWVRAVENALELRRVRGLVV